MNHLICSSIGLLPILHQPGYGIFTSPNLLRIEGRRRIPTLIFLINSVFTLSRFIFVESILSVFQINSTCTLRLFIISRKVKTSPIFGTLLSVALPTNRLAAIMGKLAFFDQLISTVQLICCHHFIFNIVFLFKLINSTYLRHF